DSRKQAVSIRMNRSDVRHIKRLAERLGTRDSDVIRFAIKLMLAKLAPLHDLSTRGRNLVPVFLEYGPDLIRHFELDTTKVAAIINEGADPDRGVEQEDIQLITMSGVQRSYVKLRFAGAASTAAGSQGDEDTLAQSLRQYLYEKYLFAK